MAAQSCVAVQGTTLWNVLITPVTPLKSVARSMVLQAAILKVIMSGKLSRNFYRNFYEMLKMIWFRHCIVQPHLMTKVFRTVLDGGKSVFVKNDKTG